MYVVWGSLGWHGEMVEREWLLELGGGGGCWMGMDGGVNIID